MHCKVKMGIKEVWRWLVHVSPHSKLHSWLMVTASYMNTQAWPVSQVRPTGGLTVSTNVTQIRSSQWETFITSIKCCHLLCQSAPCLYGRCKDWTSLCEAANAGLTLPRWRTSLPAATGSYHTFTSPHWVSNLLATQCVSWPANFVSPVLWMSLADVALRAVLLLASQWATCMC